MYSRLISFISVVLVCILSISSGMYAQTQEDVKMTRILNALGKNSFEKKEIKGNVEKVETKESENVKATRILNSLGNAESVRMGNTGNEEVMGVLNMLDNTEALQEMSELTSIVSQPVAPDVTDVLNVLVPARIDGTADAILSEYYKRPDMYQANLMEGVFSSMMSDNILDYISGAYKNSNYYDDGFWGKDSQNATLSLYKGTLPKYDPADFYRPVWGRITSNFGFRPSFGRMHKGVDLALNIGDTVRAALPGIVGRVGYEPGGYGNFIVVAHNNGVETRYAHLNQSIVMPGQKVEAGEPIALGGNTGNSTGPHLHFEVRYMGTPLDPLAMFDFSGRTMNMAGRKGIATDTNPRKLATGLSGTKTSLKEKSTYVVRQGDTVKSIAKRAGITPLKLCQLNFITEDTPLQAGTMLKLK
ncbi:MAG: peptidoglycan DD-metalloendopeptidase family protein [Muribaculaceae bacterium]|nr:peptidoglycan DD-metalloendopeptidase family protein [Muribaculaceae bacterium]MDE6755151.1 peptidoglycan DD-metalloendopeptidase family protein [Muribaculaceae bacterium]